MDIPNLFVSKLAKQMLQTWTINDHNCWADVPGAAPVQSKSCCRAPGRSVLHTDHSKWHPHILQGAGQGSGKVRSQNLKQHCRLYGKAVPWVKRAQQHREHLRNSKLAVMPGVVAVLEHGNVQSLFWFSLSSAFPCILSVYSFAVCSPLVGEAGWGGWAERAFLRGELEVGVGTEHQKQGKEN